MTTGNGVTTAAFVTSQWTRTTQRRRGDPLGFTAIVDAVSTAFVPGLTDRTRDLRWLTLLSWALAHTNEQIARPAFQTAVARRGDAVVRYELLRPIECLCIAATRRDLPLRAFHAPGIRAIGPWETTQASERFGMSSAQWKRYRQLGPYGSYRVLLRGLAGLTKPLTDADPLGDGWRPGPLAYRLAELVDSWFGRTFPVIDPTAPADQCRPALRRWPRRRSGWLSDLTHPSRLTGRERALLEPALFGDDSDGRRRRAVVRASAASKADDVAGLVSHLIQRLPALRPWRWVVPFTRFADAAFAVFTALNQRLSPDEPLPVRTLADDLRAELSSLRARARSCTGLREVAMIEPLIVSLAAALVNRSNERILRALLAHHSEHADGRRWFHCRSDGRVRLLMHSAPPASYRYRLGTLARAGVQLGVVRRLPQLFRSLDVEDQDDSDEDSP